MLFTLKTKQMKNGIKLLLSIPLNEVIEVPELGNLQNLASRLKKEKRGVFKTQKSLNNDYSYNIKRIK